jgi:hypothetical protein
MEEQMRRIWIGMSVLVMVFAIAATQSLGAGQQQTGALDDRMRSGQQEQPRNALVDNMLGKSVQNEQGQDFGRVFALATRNGEIAYILMAKEGNASELTPIPFSAARFDTQTDAFILSDAADSELAQAPTITLDELQKLDDPEFERRVHSYYGQESELEDSEPTLQPDAMTEPDSAT